MEGENARVSAENRSRERGASLVLVSGALVAFVAIAALAVDYGQLVVQRRAMVTATDAASLAAAAVFADGGTDGCDEAEAYLQTNAPANETFTCNVYPDADGGVVEVTSSQTVSYGFASVFGMNSGTAHSSTASEFITRVGLGVRPFTLCDKADPALTAWLVNRDTEMTLRLPLQNTVNPTPCDPTGHSPGNWGTGDLDGGSNPIGDTRDWIEFGYQGPIFTSTLPDSCQTAPVPEAEACYNADPGNISNSLNDAMVALRDSNDKFYIPVFELAEAQGGNFITRYNLLIIGELEDFKIKGNPRSKYIEFKLYPDSFLTSVDPGVRICGALAVECP